MDDSIPQEGGDNSTAAAGEMSSTIWIQSGQLDVVQRCVAKPDQPGRPSLADAKAEARRRGE